MLSNSLNRLAAGASGLKSNFYWIPTVRNQRRNFMWKTYYFPFTAKLDDDEYFAPPTSQRTLYPNLFDQTDNPKLFQIDAEVAPQHRDVSPTDDPAQYVMPSLDPHRIEYAHASPEVMYYQYFEDTFPKQPDLTKGELATGALVTRTSVWHNPGEPSIKSIARFEPSNFQAAGYAENALKVTHTPPAGSPQFDEIRLEPGHADRRAFTYLAQAGALAGYISGVRWGIYWFLAQFVTLEPGMQWPKPVELKYKELKRGEQIVVSAAGSSAFVRHRTDEDIHRARADDALFKTLRDPELDTERCPDPNWLICSAICTHFGCTPHHGGDFGGFLCPCHGSHYDSSGRIRAGPAPRNLPLIHFEHIDEDTVLLGEQKSTERRYT